MAAATNLTKHLKIFSKMNLNQNRKETRVAVDFQSRNQCPNLKLIIIPQKLHLLVPARNVQANHIADPQERRHIRPPPPQHFPRGPGMPLQLAPLKAHPNVAAPIPQNAQNPQHLNLPRLKALLKSLQNRLPKCHLPCLLHSRTASPHLLSVAIQDPQSSQHLSNAPCPCRSLQLILQLMPTKALQSQVIHPLPSHSVQALLNVHPIPPLQSTPPFQPIPPALTPAH